MLVHIELNIPPHFFDSAKKQNDFESVSERIAKLFLSSIVGINNIRRGDAEAFEPDYVAGDRGYEVTFAIKDSLIPQLKGARPLDTADRNIEKEIVEDIINAVERKAGKYYCCPTSVVIISLETIISWYSDFKHNETNPCERLLDHFYCMKYLKTRNHLFDELFNEYVASGKFKNIYIIQPTHDNGFALYDIEKYSEQSSEFITLTAVTPPEAFPTCKVIDLVKENYDSPIRYRTTIINWKPKT